MGALSEKKIIVTRAKHQAEEFVRRLEEARALPVAIPTIEITDDGRLIVEFETPRGMYAQVVQFNQPVTITDDINPFAHIELVGEAVMIRRP